MKYFVESTYKVEETPDLTMTIKPSYRTIAAPAVLMCYLAYVQIAQRSLAYSLFMFKQNPIFLIHDIVKLAAPLLLLAACICYTYAREIIKVDRDSISITQQLFGRSKTKTFNRSEIIEFKEAVTHINRQHTSSTNKIDLVGNSGSYSFAHGLDDDAISEVLAKLKERMELESNINNSVS
jgi:hypothetical protein